MTRWLRVGILLALTVGSAGVAGRLQPAHASVSGTIAGTAWTAPTTPAERFGVAGVRVDVYDATGTDLGRAITAADGTYSLKVMAATAAVRVVFAPPEPYVPAPRSADSAGLRAAEVRSLTLHSAPVNADIALVLPNECTPGTAATEAGRAYC